MISSNKPIKEILSRYFFQYWRVNNHKFPENLRDYILYTVNKSFECGDPEVGYTSFLCLKCNLVHKTPFSCKSRLCSSCGKIYAEKWADNIKDQLISKEHRHFTFSLPKGWIRDFFFNKRELLAELAKASYLALSHMFSTKTKVLSFGSINVIHTFSRTMDWNPHIHAIVTCGGVNSSNIWKNVSFFPWKLIRKSWQRCTLDIISKYAKSTNNQNLKNKISIAYKRYPNGFYVNGEAKISNNKNIAKYIGRYLSRPPIAEYRIISFNEKCVTFWFEDLDTKKRKVLTLSISKFIGRLLSHIPPKHFKMIRRFGLYSRRSKNKIPKKIKLFKAKFSWAERFFKTFGINPLICRRCNSQLHLLEIFHIKYGVIQYNEYIP